MKRTALYNMATWLVPLVCLLVVAGIVVYETRRIRDLQWEQEQVEKSIAIHERLLQQVEQVPPPARFPTAEMTPKEQPDFLNTLRASADASQVRLIKWSNTTPAPTAAGADPGRRKLPEGVLAISSGVEIAGRYDRLREFLYSLLRSARLYSITDVKWRRGDTWPITQLSFTLTRYVTTGKSPFGEVLTETAPPGTTYGAPSAFGTGGEGRSTPPPMPPPGQPLGPGAPDRMPGSNP